MTDANSADRKDTEASNQGSLELERYALLESLKRWLEIPMPVLAFIWSRCWYLNSEAELAGARAIAEFRSKIAALRGEIRALAQSGLNGP